ncbi:MAG TPA: YbfB/YjiJ family MFS transporter [Aliidongia sp.]|nr:YbfB/YjiJ family MFS transporter [Aliidongia sp.]
MAITRFVPARLRPVADDRPIHWFRAALPGLAATLVGVGLGRFIYTPILPFLIAEHWLRPGEAGYAGAANLAGYLAGAAIAHRLGRALGARRVIRAALVLTALAFLACALPWGFWWLAWWRFVPGVTGAVLMILGPSRVLMGVAPAARGRVAGVILTGAGIGVLMGSALVAPLAARGGVSSVWFGMAVLTLAATALSWRGWRREPALVRAADAGIAAVPPAAPMGAAILLLIVGYACDGTGFVPHTLFWVDYLARGLGLGGELGAASWLMFGVGAACGPMVLGAFADRVGLGRMIVATLLVKAGAIFLPVATSAWPALLLSPFLVGALSPGLSSLVSARLAELYAHEGHSRAWGFATFAFAISQAGGGYAAGWAFERFAAYRPLFLIGGTVELLGALLCAVAWMVRNSASPSRRSAAGSR